LLDVNDNVLILAYTVAISLDIRSGHVSILLILELIY
jgi:hypothetical protein